MGTFVVLAVLIAVVALIVRGIVRDKKSGKPERPQTPRHYEIINSISADHAQSNAERILNRSARKSGGLETKNCRTAVRQFFVLVVYSITAPAQGRRPWR